MAEVKYLVGPEGEREQRIRRAATIPEGLDKLSLFLDDFRNNGKKFRLKPRGRNWNQRRLWSPAMRLFEVRDTLSNRLQAQVDNDRLDHWLITPVGRDIVFGIREEIIEPRVELPIGGTEWPTSVQRMYRFIYEPGQFNSGRPSFLGVYNCRFTRSGGCWSYHSWRQAIDSGFVEGDGEINHDLANEMERKVQSEFGRVLMYIVTYHEDPTFHWNHNHNQVKPERACSQRPPCAG